MITKFTVQEINQNSIFLNTGWLKLADHIKLWRLFCWRSKSFDRSFHLKESRMECCTDIAWVDCRVGFQGSNGGIGNKQRKLQGTKVYQINFKGASVSLNRQRPLDEDARLKQQYVQISSVSKGNNKLKSDFWNFFQQA